MQFILIDLEATCWQGFQNGRQREIIEIGAVRLDGYGSMVDTFETLVRPVHHPRLSAYCTELTGIRTDMLRRAPEFPEAIEAFLEWADPWAQHTIWAAWGDFDRELLLDQLEEWGLDDDWLDPYIDVKRQYQELRRWSRQKGLVSALRAEGLEYEGRQHRGLDDARNLARLFVRHIDEWRF